MRHKGRLWIFTGLLLVAAAFSLTGYNFRESERAVRNHGEVLEKIGQLQETVLGTQKDQIMKESEMPTAEINGVSYIGILEIKDLGLQLPVISQWSYPDLKKAPCRYSGSAYQGNLVICAHNYQTHFGNLKKLQTGAEVSFTDIDGNEFLYEVAGFESVGPEEAETVENGMWELSLFTCTLGGKNRIIVRCEGKD